MYRNPFAFKIKEQKWTEGDPLNGLLGKEQF
jgi:hypothetical protein